MASAAEELNLPVSYGENYIMLMVQSPSVIFLYWDLSAGQISALKGHEALLLRLYSCEETDAGNGSLREEVALPPFTNNWYFNNISPCGCYYAELGYRDGENEFIFIMRSNAVETPLSQVIRPFDESHALMMPVIPPQKKAGTGVTECDLEELTVSFAEAVSSMSFYMGIILG